MTFADDYNVRDKDTVTLNDIGDALDALLLAVSDATYATAAASELSTASTSFANITDSDLSVTVASGETVILIGRISVSADTVNSRLGLACARDSSNTTANTQATVSAGDSTSTAGHMESCTIFDYDTPSAGTYTYRLKWKNVDTSVTLYSRYGELTAIKVRTS